MQATMTGIISILQLFPLKTHFAMQLSISLLCVFPVPLASLRGMPRLMAVLSLQKTRIKLTQAAMGLYAVSPCTEVFSTGRCSPQQ